MSGAIEAIDRELGAVYGSRSWLVASDVLQGAGRTVRRLRAWGAPQCFAIAARMGVGDLPQPEDWEHRVLGLPNAPMMEAIHSAENALRDLPREVIDAVDAFDPQRAARVIGTIVSDGRPVAGRAFWGARPRSWRELEDKVLVDRLWDACGIPRMDSEVVAVDHAALRAAHRRLDRGAGTVWAGDATKGFHGGGAYTFPVRSETEAARATEALAKQCVRARVMPYLEGIPCSIHGIVFPDHVVVLRPAELLVLRHAATGRFVYCRADTFWDPPTATRASMREAARTAGTMLRQSMGYRGAFTIDGVATGEGFRPTELNPRVGAALALMDADFPFSFLHDALVEGVAFATDPIALETSLVARADAARRANIAFFAEVPIASANLPIRFDHGAWSEVERADDADGVLTMGPGPTGSVLTLVIDPDHASVGTSLAPRVAILADFVDRKFGVGIGPLVPASDARSS